MITFQKPKINVKNDKAIMTCEVLIGNETKEIFYEIDKEYKDYLCIERSDAFIIAAVYYAMKHHHDITSDIPLTSSIYYSLTTYLIPTLAKHSNNLSIIKLNVPIIDEEIKTKGAVGTGISCGIDSMHTLKNYLNPKIKNMKLTHLCLNNVGSFKAYAQKYKGIGSDRARDLLIERAIKVAKEVNLPIIITNSNIHKIFNDTYFRVHSFANMFSVFLLQKLFSKYFYASSGYDLSHYNVIDTINLDSAEYELLLFYSLTTSTLKIYTEGSEKTRLEKTIDIADFDLAQKYLHICIKDGINCGKCLKCRRTLLSLEAIGKLDNFKDVFDIDYYKTHKDEYYKWLDKEVKNHSIMNTNTYKLLQQKKGNTIYNDIEIYNKKNIIIPENEISSISIKKDKYILNKNSKKLYKSNLYSRISTCIDITKVKNKEIKIAKKLLINYIIVFLKNKELKYLKKAFSRRNTKIMLYDLIYFILYKPEQSKKIIKFLYKKGYLTDKNHKKNRKKFTAENLVDIFESFIKNDILKEALKVKSKKIGAYKITNRYCYDDCKNTYYQNDEYDYTFLEVKRNKYYFLGLSNDYSITMVSKFKNKNDIYENASVCYNLIKNLID